MEGNPLGDPCRRTTFVLAPQDAPHSRPLPSIWLLAGFTGRGGSYLNLNPWQETLCERLDRLSSEGLPPVRVILPDCFTRLGGSQYLDSPAIGPYATYLWDELRVQLEAEYVTPHRGVMGKSSGGFGSFYSVMTHPGLFQAMASHSGDMLFPWAYLPDFPRAYQIIADCGSVAQFLQCFEKNPDKSSAWINAMNIIAMAYAYSPNLNNAGVPADFPLDFDTLQVDTPVWEKWLRFDPLKMVDEPLFQNALRQLSGLYFDAGKKDEFQLQYGAMQMDAKLTRYNIVHRFELYDGGHFRTSHRLDISLAFLAGALTSDGG